MNSHVYLSVLSKLSTVMPLFAKALLEMSLRKRGKTVETLGPLELIEILREDLDPKLRSLGLNYRSVLCAAAAQIQTNSADEVVYINSPATRLLDQLAPGLKPSEAFQTLQQAGLLKSVKDLRELEVREWRDEKTGRFYNLTLTPLQGLGVSAVLQDFTLREEIEEELRLSYRKLEEEVNARMRAEESLVVAAKLSAIGEMSSGIAHEIRNPLGNILLRAGMMKTLAQAGKLDAQGVVRGASEIVETAQRINGIITGLQAMAREGAADPFVTVSVQKAVQDALDFCSHRITKLGIRLLQHPIPQGLIIEARSTEISQIILNLLNNATDAVEQLPEKWIDISAVERGEWVELAVMDSGHGISQEIAEKIMNPFFTTKPVTRGTGLGLSISRKIAHAHQGFLELDRASVHTRFVLKLPKRSTK